MNSQIKKLNSSHFALFGILIVVIVGGFTLFRQDKNLQASDIDSGAFSEVPVEVPVEVLQVPVDMDVFAKCLSENGATLYGAIWCPHCQVQKKAFGESVQYINYIECSPDGSKTQAQVCKNAGIQGYPTWKFADGSEIFGEATLAQLGEKTGCLLDSEVN